MADKKEKPVIIKLPPFEDTHFPHEPEFLFAKHTSRIFYGNAENFAKLSKLEANRRHGYTVMVEGTDLWFPLAIIRGSQPGPTTVITAGIHAAEYPGIKAALELSYDLDFSTITGTVIIVAMANAAGFWRRSNSMVPGSYTSTGTDQNLNRIFPGNAQGSPDERLAAALFALIETADYYIDLHSGDSYESLIPHAYFCAMPAGGVLGDATLGDGTLGDAALGDGTPSDNALGNKPLGDEAAPTSRDGVDATSAADAADTTATISTISSEYQQICTQSQEMAHCVKVPYLVPFFGYHGGTAYSEACKAGIPGILIERGGMGLCERVDVDNFKADVMNLLRKLGCMHGVFDTYEDAQEILATQHFDAAHVTGVWSPRCKSGDSVYPNQVLGTITDPLGNTLETILAKGEGVILYQTESLNIIAGELAVAYAEE